MSQRRREAFIAYLATLREAGVVRPENTAGENAARVAVAAAADFAAVGLAPLRDQVADLLGSARDRLRGKR